MARNGAWGTTASIFRPFRILHARYSHCTMLLRPSDTDVVSAHNNNFLMKSTAMPSTDKTNKTVTDMAATRTHAGKEQYMKGSFFRPLSATIRGTAAVCIMLLL